MAITRKLPNTLISRQNALTLCVAKQNTITPGNEVLHPTTAARLIVNHTLYNTAMQNLAVAKSVYSTNTPTKTEQMNMLRLYCSHFIQGFNMGVLRGKFPAGHRVLYTLPESHAKVPSMGSDSNTIALAERLIAGDANRLLAGGAAMSNPDIGELTAVYTTAKAAFITQNTLSEALKKRQNELDKLTPKLDKFIARIWNEIVAYYSENDADGTRAHARSWGVVYVSESTPALLTGLVLDAQGNAREGAEVVVLETGAKTTTNAEGRYQLATTLVGEATVRASFNGEPDASTVVTIAEHHDEVTLPVDVLVVG